MTTPWTTADIPDQTGRIAVVTGANSGIGFEASLEELAKKGAHVVMACRSAERAQGAVDAIRAAHPAARIEVITLDLASLNSIRGFAKKYAETHDRVDLLINNAGLMALPRTLTEDGFEMQLGTNHLGHFALTGLLLQRLTKAKSARVVSVSSMAHKTGKIRLDDLMGEKRYGKWSAYGQSKLANLLFTYELARRLEKSHPNVVALACHPGYAATNLQQKGPQMEGSAVGAWLMKLGNGILAQDAAAGALPTLRAATDPEARSADYYGPDGLLEWTGSPIKVSSNARSHDADVAAKLWEVSVKLTGVDFAGL